MNMKYKTKMANQDEINLYIIVGEALCMTQHLEDCLSHSIIIKKEPRNISRMQADGILEKYRTYTLGKAINFSTKNSLFSEEIQQELQDFLTERNWLVHKSIAHNRDDLAVLSKRNNLIQRVKQITNRATAIIHLLEEDLMNYCSSKGADMSKVREAIRLHYSN